MIAIKGMKEMPSCCYECPYFDDYCDLTGKWECDTEQIRDADCPLVEIATCKDCKHCHFDSSDQTFFCSAYGNLVCPSHYCSSGERKE